VDYERLREAALGSRGEAFPLGLGLLRRAGITAWCRASAALRPTVAQAAPTAAPHPARDGLAGLPVALSVELVDALAAVALAGTTTPASRAGPTRSCCPSGSSLPSWRSPVAVAVPGGMARC
jgi:hypothetical protein